MIWEAPNMWDGGECFIIGGGPSVAQQFGVPADVMNRVRTGELSISFISKYMTDLHGRHVIGVNNAYLLGTWVDICFFGDCAWYLVHQARLANWPNLKITCCPRFENRPKQKMEGVKYLAKDRNHRAGITSNRSKVAWNNNSGAAAISLAYHLGVKRVILLGFDMAMGQNGASHWHAGHGYKKPPGFARHMRGFPAIAEDAARLGIEILNASPGSAIGEFKKVSLREVLK